MLLGSNAGLAQALGRSVGNSGRDAAPMEPVGTLEYLVEVEVLGLGLGNGAVGAVVNHLGGTHRSAGLSIIEAYTIAAAGHEVAVDTITTHAVERNLTDLMLGKLGNKIAVVAVVGTRNGHIGFATAGDNLEAVSLNKTIVTFGGKTKHQFAHGHNFCHIENF